MSDTDMIVRYRDLTVELNGSIRDHQAILRRFGEVWWGWFHQVYEQVPRSLFGSIVGQIRETGPVIAWLFDSGQTRLHKCKIIDIRVAPTRRGIPSPDPERSPEYYHRGRYGAWFKLDHIEPVDFADLELVFAAFPTRPDAKELKELIGVRIDELEHLRNARVTLWVVAVKQRQAKCAVPSG